MRLVVRLVVGRVGGRVGLEVVRGFVFVDCLDFDGGKLGYLVSSFLRVATSCS